ncbi:hypothetical protein LOK49_LG04G00498 [Camellia lanceoleosa]|uniref:Uncharacterized protein n=1 Tax=Camellia lanceoleosa TaxID=1840588 RepID=A0ACC0I140_9ERIC|nr:hypothetical protein LOK49_LG04G00498 [Camellia lanceoleosa]
MKIEKKEEDEEERERERYSVLGNWFQTDSVLQQQEPFEVDFLPFSKFISSFFAATRRVNKPYLPIAGGDLLVQPAWFLVLLFAVTGLLIVGINFGPFITALYCLGLFLGTIYSVPPFRMKRFPVVAFLIIATV